MAHANAARPITFVNSIFRGPRGDDGTPPPIAPLFDIKSQPGRTPTTASLGDFPSSIFHSSHEGRMVVRPAPVSAANTSFALLSRRHRLVAMVRPPAPLLRLVSSWRPCNLFSFSHQSALSACHAHHRMPQPLFVAALFVLAPLSQPTRHPIRAQCSSAETGRACLSVLAFAR
jgi:hypothetical protein